MTTAIYLVGATGSGKSTVMRALLDQLGLATGDWFKIWPSPSRAEFRGEPLEDIVTGEARGLSLGVTRGEFSGTDAIGLASHGEAMNWLNEAPELPSLILGEGARLGTPLFLTKLSLRTDLTVGHLTVPERVQEERLQRRWAAQEAPSGRSEAFRKGTRTRAINATAGVAFRVVELDTSELDPDACAKILLETTSVM